MSHASCPHIGAALDVLRERYRQINNEGFDTGHDDRHPEGELARAASAYAFFGSLTGYARAAMAEEFPEDWPFSADWWKPTDRRGDLIKAAALIIADIERIDRTEGRA